MISSITPHRHLTTGRPKTALLSDEELLLRYREQGDRQAFNELVHRYERELFSYLKRYLGDATMAEDAFQGAFLQLHLKCDQFEAHRKVRPWLYTIATHQAIDAQRRNKRHRMVSLDRSYKESGDDELGSLMNLLVGDEESPQARLEGAEQSRWVRGAVDALADPLKTAVNLIYFQGLKYREAAEVLDIPVGTVKSRLHTAILKLNEAWRQSHPQRNDHPTGNE